MTSKRTGRGTVLFGLLVLLAGIGGAVVLYLLSQQRDDDAIRDLARAPVGCDTTSCRSATPGRSTCTSSISGRLEELDGDCDASTDEYSRDPDDEPVGRDHACWTTTATQIELDRLDEEFTYSLDDSFAGTATRQFEIETDRRLCRERSTRPTVTTSSWPSDAIPPTRATRCGSARSRRASPASCSDAGSCCWASAAAGGHDASRRRTPPEPRGRSELRCRPRLR